MTTYNKISLGSTLSCIASENPIAPKAVTPVVSSSIRNTYPNFTERTYLYITSVNRV